MGNIRPPRCSQCRASRPSPPPPPLGDPDSDTRWMDLAVIVSLSSTSQIPSGSVTSEPVHMETTLTSFLPQNLNHTPPSALPLPETKRHPKRVPVFCLSVMRGTLKSPSKICRRDAAEDRSCCSPSRTPHKNNTQCETHPRDMCLRTSSNS